jgi:hypothetical protein
MAKKKAKIKPLVNKSKEVRKYMKAHPGVQNKEISEALTKRGIKISAGYVSTIKVIMKKREKVLKEKAGKAQR